MAKRKQRLMVKHRGRMRVLPFTQKGISEVQELISKGEVHFMDVDVV